jgi:hypothetical protein
MNLLDEAFPSRYRAPQMKIVCQNYTPGKLIHQTTKIGSTSLLDFHLSGLGFWILFMLKIHLEPHCNHLLVNVNSHHIAS